MRGEYITLAEAARLAERAAILAYLRKRWNYAPEARPIGQSINVHIEQVASEIEAGKHLGPEQDRPAGEPQTAAEAAIADAAQWPGGVLPREGA